MLEFGSNYGNLSLIFSLIALIFLIYTIINLENLNITITHPRVLVELALFIIFLIIGVWLKFYS
jgi:hypothetical protein